MKLFFFILLLLLASFSVKGQSALGVKPMLGLSQVQFQPGVSQNFNIGFGGGVIYKYVTKKHVGVQLEINYIQKGWQQSLPDGIALKTTLDYLEVPLMTHAFLGKKSVKFFLNLGPYIAYLLAIDDGVEGYDTDGSTLFIPQFNGAVDSRWDIGLLGGLGISKTFKSSIIQVEGRFASGLSNLIKPPEFGSQNVSKNQTISFSVAYLFSL